MTPREAAAATRHEWMDLMFDRGPLDDDPNWTCCGDPGCSFARKCSDTERMDAAWEFRSFADCPGMI